VDELGKAAAALKVCSMIYIVPLSVVFWERAFIVLNSSWKILNKYVLGPVNYIFAKKCFIGKAFYDAKILLFGFNKFSQFYLDRGKFNI
jgi:hypothetical protein